MSEGPLSGPTAMRERRRVTTTLRGLAIGIAVMAVIDPAITSTRRSRPLISIVSTDDSATSARSGAVESAVTSSLRNRYTLMRAPFGAAAGTILIGDRVTDASQALATPVVVVSPYATAPDVSIERVQAPSRVSIDARVPVVVTLRSKPRVGQHPASDSVQLSLAQRTDGLDAIVVATEWVPVPRNDDATRDDTRTATRTFTRTLSFVPSVDGATVLQARVVSPGRADTIRADVMVEVGRPRWSVLFFDRRPSWMSTFVRRSLERDPRFAVTSRIITSTGISRETGNAPTDLSGVASSESFDVVVVGAPEALTVRDVDGLRRLLRSRGVSVLVLADHAAASPADGLMGFGGWRTAARRTPADVYSIGGPRLGDAGSAAVPANGETAEAIHLRGLSIGVPTTLPPGAEPLAVLGDSGGETAGPSASRARITASETVIWRTAIGAGQLIVSGAFDAWRYRDSAQSTFDATWRDLVEHAASQRQRPLEVELSDNLVSPRATVRVLTSVRDTLQSQPSHVMVRLQGADAGSVFSVRLHPSQPSSRRVAVFRAPAEPGTYELLAATGADSARTTLVVAPPVARGADERPALLTAWAQSRGGDRVERADLATLSDRLEQLIRPVARPVEWHPMRSPWWIVPFSVLLAAEWWIRRRRGLA